MAASKDESHIKGQSEQQIIPALPIGVQRKIAELQKTIKRNEPLLSKHDMVCYQNAEATLEIAKLSKDSSYFAKAIALFSDAIRLNPDSRVYVVDRGLAYLANQQIDKAKEDLAKAQNMPEGEIHESLEDYAKIKIVELNDLLHSKAKEDSNPLETVGMFKLQRNIPQATAASKDESHIKGQSEQHTAPVLSIGVQRKIAELQKNIKRNQSILSKSDQACCQNARAILKIAELSDDLSYLVNAIALYSDAIRLNPDSRMYVVERGLAYLANQQIDKAKEDLAKAQSMPEGERYVTLENHVKIKIVELNDLLHSKAKEDSNPLETVGMFKLQRNIPQAGAAAAVSSESLFNNFVG